MSYSERRNRKNRRAKTPGELWAWRCWLCAQKITHRQVRGGLTYRRAIAGPPWRGDMRRFEIAHILCPPFIIPNLTVPEVP